MPLPSYKQKIPRLEKAYEVMSENLDPSTDEFRALPLESRRLLSMQPEVRIQDNLMVKERDERVQVVVPVVLRKRLFEIAHNAAHLGSRRTYQQLNTSYYWYGMRQDIIRWCRQCQYCAKGKGPPLRPHGQLQKIPVGAPMDLVTMDILSGLPTADDSSKYILVVVDAFTKWVEAYPLPDQEAATCITAVYNGMFSRFGLPRQLHSDQGRNFESQLVTELCNISGIYKTRTTAFHPRSDGLTERANRTILAMLRAAAYKYTKKWPWKLSTVLAAYRMTVHSTTGVTPNRAMLGREVLLPASLIVAPPEESEPQSSYVQDFQDSLRQAHQQVRQAMGSSAKAEKTYFDRRMKKYSFFVNQKVWRYWPKPLVRQKHRKVTRVWTGPWTIITLRSPIVVELKDIASGRKQIVHVDRIVRCLNQETVTDTEVIEQMPPSPTQAVADTQPTPSYLTEHQTSSESQDVDSQSSYGRIIRRPMRYR